MNSRRAPLALLAIAWTVAPCLCHAAVIRGTLKGSVTIISAKDADQQVDDAAFQAILPFAVGAPVVAEFQYDTDTGQFLSSGNNYNFLEGDLSIRIGDSTVFRWNAPFVDIYVSDNTVNGGDRLLFRPSSAFSPQSVFPAGWTHAYDFGTAGSSNTNFDVQLLDATGNAVTGRTLPTPPLSLQDFTGATFTIFTTMDPGGTSTWSVPGGGTYVGGEQIIAGGFTELVIVEVPEPAAIGSMLIALVSVLALRCRRLIS